jgi:hypothetical protein
MEWLALHPSTTGWNNQTVQGNGSLESWLKSTFKERACAISTKMAHIVAR